MVADGWGVGGSGGKGELVFDGNRTAVWGGEKVLELDGGDGRTTCKCT